MQPATPITAGVKIARWAAALHRCRLRLAETRERALCIQLGGAVGTLDAIGGKRVMVRNGLAMRLRLHEARAWHDQRDDLVRLMAELAIVTTTVGKIARDVSLLSQAEVGEMLEAAPVKGVGGSSAMPHKRNPILTERICGLARVLRGNATAAVENVPLWHERDISHSSAERVILPDSTILLDYVQDLGLRVVREMTVHTDRMRANLELTHGALFSQRVLLALVEGGMQRADAYPIVQSLAQRAWDEGTPLRDLLAAEPAAAGLDLDAIFDYGHYTRHVPEVLARLDEVISPV
jgi:adenylosuccinate lyase